MDSVRRRALATYCNVMQKRHFRLRYHHAVALFLNGDIVYRERMKTSTQKLRHDLYIDTVMIKPWCSYVYIPYYISYLQFADISRGTM